MPRSVPTPYRSILAAVLLSSGLLAIAPDAAGQTTPARYVTVASDNAPLRSGDLERFYRVADLSAGAVLRVVAEEDGWLRVAYPNGLTSFVRARDADRQGNNAVLNKPRKLRAANLTAGFNGSWKSLLPEALPAGTRLPIIEEIVGADGAVVGYRVPAPADATGYVAQRLTRAASAAEIDAALRATGGALSIPDSPIQTPRTAPSDASTVATNDAPPAIAPPAETDPADATPAETLADVQPASEPSVDATPDSAPAHAGNAGSTDSADSPSDRLPATPPADAVIADAASDAPIEADTATPSDEPDEPAQATLAELEASFAALQGQPIETTVVTPLLNEYKAMLGRLTDSPADRRRAQRIGHRIELLELREDFRSRLLALDDSPVRPEPGDAGLDAPRRADNGLPAAPAPVDRAVPTDIRISVRGQLAPSLIYNGQGLPLLYRLVAPGSEDEPSGSRTLAYLEPDAATGLASNLGSIIEVEGVARFAQGGQVRVIDADRFRVITARR